MTAGRRSDSRSGRQRRELNEIGSARNASGQSAIGPTIARSIRGTVGTWAKLVVLVLILAACAPAKLDGTELGAAPAPDFTLSDVLTGADLSLSSLRPQVVVLSFLYTHCPDTCPLTAERFREAQAALGADATRVEFVAVSVDPAGDTAASVRAFSEDHRLSQRWHYLTGSRTHLSGVWALYGIGVVDNGTAVVPHNDALYLLDAQGRERLLMHSSAQSETLASNLRVLLKG